VSQANL